MVEKVHVPWQIFGWELMGPRMRFQNHTHLELRWVTDCFFRCVYLKITKKSPRKLIQVVKVCSWFSMTLIDFSIQGFSAIQKIRLWEPSRESTPPPGNMALLRNYITNFIPFNVTSTSNKSSQILSSHDFDSRTWNSFVLQPSESVARFFFQEEVQANDY